MNVILIHPYLLSIGISHVRCPELQEVFEGRESDVDAEEESVAQEQDEELVIFEGDTVVHPRAMMVHLKTIKRES